MRLAVHAAIFFALTTAAAPADNFIGSCDANSVKVSDRIVTANCRTILGAWQCSKLDLNRCIKNSYGSLQADPTGSGPHFGDQCISCTNGQPTTGILTGGPTLLQCQCNPGTGAAQVNWPTAIFDLNTIIDNANGKLECFGNKAASCYAKRRALRT